MLLDDCVESLLILIRAHFYVNARYTDFIAIGRVQVWVRHAEFVVLNFPASGPFPTHFNAEEHAIGPEVTHPMRAIGATICGVRRFMTELRHRRVEPPAS